MALRYWAIGAQLHVTAMHGSALLGAEQGGTSAAEIAYAAAMDMMTSAPP